MDSLESLNRKIHGASDIKSVVKTMKSLAASNIGQYEAAVISLNNYYHTIVLGLVAYFIDQKIAKIPANEQFNITRDKETCVLVFGSDLGLVGSFNDSLVEFVAETVKTLPGNMQVWAVGERVHPLLLDAGMNVTKNFMVPGSATSITPLIGKILLTTQQMLENRTLSELYVFYNKPKSVTGYSSVFQRVMPMDEAWRQQVTALPWPTKLPAQVVGNSSNIFLSLVREFVFVSLYKACAESLASENASRLAAMQRAEKNIGELLEELAHSYHRLRQSSIDEELFDVLAGFEALKDDAVNKIRKQI